MMLYHKTVMTINCINITQSFTRPLLSDISYLLYDLFWLLKFVLMIKKINISFLSLHPCRVALESGTTETYNILTAKST
jgi:hypothetical protein